MKLLLLTKKFPYPLKDGESQAIHGLSKSLSELGCEVSLLAMNTTKHYFAGTELPEKTAHYPEARTVTVDHEISPLDALAHLVRGTAHHITRFDITEHHPALSPLPEDTTSQRVYQ